MRLLFVASAFEAGSSGVLRTQEAVSSYGSVRVAVCVCVSGEPIVEASVTLVGMNRFGRSNPRGQVRFDHVTQREDRIEVRAIGYVPATAAVRPALDPSDSTAFLISLVPIAQPIEREMVYGGRRLSPDEDGFELRRRLGIGYFVTSDVTERERELPLATVVAEHVPGVADGGAILESTRGSDVPSTFLSTDFIVVRP